MTQPAHVLSFNLKDNLANAGIKIRLLLTKRNNHIYKTQ